MAKVDETKEVVEKEQKTTKLSKTNEQVIEQNEVEKNNFGQKIYIGPSLLQMTTYTVIEGGYPTHIQSVIDKCPSIQKLFVPVDKFTVLEPKTKQKGTLEYRNYNDVIEFIQNERKGE